MSPPPPNPQVLYNPLWLIFLLLLFLFGKTVYQVGEARALVRRCRDRCGRDRWRYAACL